MTQVVFVAIDGRETIPSLREGLGEHHGDVTARLQDLNALRLIDFAMRESQMIVRGELALCVGKRALETFRVVSELDIGE